MNRLKTFAGVLFAPVAFVGVITAVALAGVAMLILSPFKSFREMMDEGNNLP